MAITDWPEDERPREKLFKRGSAALSDAELLAIFLGSGVRGSSAVDVARGLLGTWGGLQGLLDADGRRVMTAPGIGPARYALLQAALELGRRYLESRLDRGPVMDSPEATARYLASHLRGRPREVFACLFLDNRHRLIAYEELFMGTLDGASVHPREVVKRVLEHNAAAVILAHNHPSGVAEPSRADEAITRRLKAALELVDIRLLDHFVVGDGAPVSFAQRGLL